MQLDNIMYKWYTTVFSHKAPVIITMRYVLKEHN